MRVQCGSGGERASHASGQLPGLGRKEWHRVSAEHQDWHGLRVSEVDGQHANKDTPKCLIPDLGFHWFH